MYNGLPYSIWATINTVMLCRSLVVVAILCEHFLELVIVENRRFAVGVSSLSIIVPEI